MTTAEGEAGRRAEARARRRLLAGVRALGEIDPDLGAIREAHGVPPTRLRPPGFSTLLGIITQQQLSLASGRAIWGRLEAGLGRVTADVVLARDIENLRSYGLSLAKARYARALAEAVASGGLDFDALAALDDEAAIRALTRVKGIGRWTAEIYLLAVLQRADVFPAADVALMTAAQQVKRLPVRPDARELARLAEAWRPWRAIAARLLWHHYRHAQGREAGM